MGKNIYSTIGIYPSNSGLLISLKTINYFPLEINLIRFVLWKYLSQDEILSIPMKKIVETE